MCQSVIQRNTRTAGYLSDYFTGCQRPAFIPKVNAANTFNLGRGLGPRTPVNQVEREKKIWKDPNKQSARNKPDDTREGKYASAKFTHDICGSKRTVASCLAV